MTARLVRLAATLGLITAVGPFAIDMYLPALPSMGASLAAAPAAVQMSLTIFFIVFGVCQLGYGPLADIVGRKPPIYGGLAIFTAGSIGCALSPNVDALVGFRALQALGACAGMVVPRAIVRDLHTGPEATRLMAMLMLVVSVSPILAPLTGSFIIAGAGWRAVFWTLTGAAALAFLLAIFALKETRPVEERARSSWGGAFADYGLLLRDRPFMALTLVGSFGVSSFFVYLASASFVLIDHYGLTPQQFSLCFALNAASFFGFSQLTGRLTGRFGLMPVIHHASLGFAAAMAVAAAAMLAGVESLVVLMACLFVGYGFLGLVMPASAVLALDHHGERAGTASALMGAIQMGVGAIMMALAGWFSNGRPLPMVLGIAFSALATVGMAWLTPGSRCKPAGAVHADS
jgi:DHA1 family bicyclomycin/chloramphenicol resistance-like MFS transporter